MTATAATSAAHRRGLGLGHGGLDERVELDRCAGGSGRYGRGAGVEQELDVAVGPAQRGRHYPHDRGSEGPERGTDLAEDPPPHVGVAHDAPPAGRLLAPGLE